MPKTPTDFRIRRSHLALVALFALGLYVLVPQLSSFQASWRLLRDPELGWVTLAVGFTFGSYAFGALTYRMLAFKKLQYLRTLLVQFAAMFVNRLVPAGVGSVGVNFLYLRRMQHNGAQAASVVALNNILGFTGHAVLLVLAIIVAGGSAISVDTGSALSVLKYAAVALLVLLVAVGILRTRLVRVLRQLAAQLASYRRSPGRVLAALLSSILLTSCTLLCLYCSMLALDVHLGVAAVLFILSFGVGAGAVTPTPGGLGGFEAGLVGGFVAYGVDASAALAIALLYRLVSYWLPLVVGLVCFEFARRQGLLSMSLAKTTSVRG